MTEVKLSSYKPVLSDNPPVSNPWRRQRGEPAVYVIYAVILNRFHRLSERRLKVPINRDPPALARSSISLCCVKLFYGILHDFRHFF